MEHSVWSLEAGVLSRSPKSGEARMTYRAGCLGSDKRLVSGIVGPNGYWPSGTPIHEMSLICRPKESVVGGLAPQPDFWAARLIRLRPARYSRPGLPSWSNSLQT